MNGTKTKKSTARKQAGRNPCWCEEIGSALTQFLLELRPPEEARRHFDSARVEMLKGLRAVLDARIQRGSGAKVKGEMIKVE